MKKFSLLFVYVLLSIFSFSDSYITRGPLVGEIYFVGPTYTGTGIYYSTDFGETAICMDSIIAGDAISIVADITPGILYYVTSLESFYISYDYGQQGTWILQNGGVSHNLNSGRNEGEVYANFYSHSEDFGANFNYHTCNGYFGSSKSFSIDFIDENIGYVVASKSNIPDSVYLFYTNDNFENLEVKKVFNFPNGHIIYLTRGIVSGELYMFNRSRISLYYSNNFAEDFTLYEYYNLPNNCATVGGKQDGEFYIYIYHINMMWQNAHIYILHSIDYGITFNVYHPFAKGQEPLLANFSGIPDTSDSNSINQIPKYGGVPLDVQFYNYSIGEINTYEWDFENDGIVDSYEENPFYTYVDTGFFSVRLTVYDDFDTNSFLKENYIYVDNTTHTEDINSKILHAISNYPNPVNDYTTFEIQNTEKNIQEAYVEIFDLKGNPVFSLPIRDKAIWNRMDFNKRYVKNGIYLYRLSTQKSNVNKIILL